MNLKPLNLKKMTSFVYSSVMFLSSLFGIRKIKTRPMVFSGESSSQRGSIYDITLKTIGGKTISLADYKGKKLLIVNTASKCGFTSQLEELQKFHEQYGNNVEVLGFPSDNFGGMEYKNNDHINNFCSRNYGVTFQLFSKSDVTGPQRNELFKWLGCMEENGWNDKCPNWNFCKYLVNEQGELVSYYSSTISPLDSEVISRV